MTQERTLDVMIGAITALRKSFQLHYDVDYGVDRKSGWSVIVDGSVVVQFAFTPEDALRKALDRVAGWDTARTK